MSWTATHRSRLVALGLALGLLGLQAGCTWGGSPPTLTPVPTVQLQPTPLPPAGLTATSRPAPTATARATAAPAALAVTILKPADGAQVPEGTSIQVRFVARGGPFIEAVLWVDGKMASVIPVSSLETTYEGALEWNPSVLGSHSLTIQVMDPTKQIASADIQVVVAGGAAPPAGGMPAVDEATRQRIIQAYRDAFGLELTAPPVGRKDRSGVPNDPWVSVAWVGDLLYQVNLYPDGNIQTFATLLKVGAKPPPAVQYDSNPAARPAGTLSVLVVLLDYGNLGVTKGEVLEDLKQATASVNAEYARYAAAAGLAKPIFEIQTTGVCLSPAPDLSKSGYALTPDNIPALTGLDPAGFDFTAQVDLDADNTARNALRSVGLDTYGWAAAGLGLVPKTVNIWVAVDDKSQLTGDESRLTRTLLSHELLHLMGYPGTHDWPCTDGTTVDTADQCDAFNMPALMLGWVDTDGDGLVEILDPAPYGMVKQ